MRKMVTIFLTISIALALGINAAAFTPQTVKSLHPEFAAQLNAATVGENQVSVADLENISVSPGCVVEILLAGSGESPDLFFDQNGLPINTADVTISRLRAARITAAATMIYGEGAFGSVDLTVKYSGSPAAKPALVLTFAESCKSVDALPFKIELGLSLGGSVAPQSVITVAGTFENEKIEISSLDDNIQSDGKVLVASEYIPSVNINAGDDVLVDVRMTQGQSMWMKATRSEYLNDGSYHTGSEPVETVSLEIAGITPTGINGVKIDSRQLLYVYDQDGGYLGTTDQALKYSPHYELFRRKTAE